MKLILLIFLCIYGNVAMSMDILKITKRLKKQSSVKKKSTSTHQTKKREHLYIFYDLDGNKKEYRFSSFHKLRGFKDTLAILQSNYQLDTKAFILTRDPKATVYTSVPDQPEQLPLPQLNSPQQPEQYMPETFILTKDPRATPTFSISSMPDQPELLPLPQPSPPQQPEYYTPVVTPPSPLPFHEEYASFSRLNELFSFPDDTNY